MIEVGMIVMVENGDRYGVVKESFDHGGQKLFHVHYIDPDTGKLIHCPDPRCQGEHTCPIHGTNCTEDQIGPFTPAEIESFVQDGLIDRELLRH